MAKPPNATVAPSAAAASVVIPIAEAILAIAPSPSTAFNTVCAILNSCIAVLAPFIVVINCWIPLICNPNCPTAPIIPITLPNGDRIPLNDRLKSSHAAPNWSSNVLCSASSLANCANWPSY